MGYTLEAIIAPNDLLTTVFSGQPQARVVPLRPPLALVPMTDPLFDALTETSTRTTTLGFTKLPGGFHRSLQTWSDSATVAYVEADYFGGTGRQRAAVWEHGTLALGPLALLERDPAFVEGTPISQALARLGAGRAGHHDAFEAVGLGRHRYTEDWD